MRPGARTFARPSLDAQPSESRLGRKSRCDRTVPVLTTQTYIVEAGECSAEDSGRRGNNCCLVTRKERRAFSPKRTEKSAVRAKRKNVNQKVAFTNKNGTFAGLSILQREIEVIGRVVEFRLDENSALEVQHRNRRVLKRNAVPNFRRVRKLVVHERGGHRVSVGGVVLQRQGLGNSREEARRVGG
jgi:hypothetical protein